MKHINELASILNKHLNWNKARVTCLAQMVKGLLAVKTVNLAEIATSFSSETHSASSYRRIQRFFEKFDFSPSTIIPLIPKQLQESVLGNAKAFEIRRS